MSKLKFGIIGGGPGGQSMAAILTSKGYSAKLMDKSSEVVNKINARGKITLTGKIELEGMPELVTLDPVKAIEGTDVILVATTTDAHEDVAKAIAAQVTENQMVLLNPGMFGGSLAFKAALKKYGCPYDVIVAETADLMFGCRTVEVGHILHTGLKTQVRTAAVPASAITKLLEVLNPAFPALVPAETIWHISLGDNAILHSIPMIMNVNKMDLGQTFDYLYGWHKPQHCKDRRRSRQGAPGTGQGLWL